MCMSEGRRRNAETCPVTKTPHVDTAAVCRPQVSLNVNVCLSVFLTNTSLMKLQNKLEKEGNILRENSGFMTLLLLFTLNIHCFACFLIC